VAYRPNSPNFSLLSTGHKPGEKNGELESFARHVQERLKMLENKTGVQAINLEKQAPLAPAPNKGRLAVAAVNGSGIFKVGITLPEFVSPSVSGNLSRTPLYHEVHYAPVQDFSSNVTKLPKGHQVYWPVIETAGRRLFFRFRSSVDGINWNDWTLSGAVQG
jgi:hypothetical protein